MIENTFSDFALRLRRFVEDTFEAFAVQNVEVEEGKDHDDTPVVNVAIHHGLAEPVNAFTLIEMDGKIRDYAWQLGERRFVHVRHAFDERQSVAA